MIPKECRNCDLGFNNDYIPIQPFGELSKAKVFIITDSIKTKDMELKQIQIDKYFSRLLADLNLIGFNTDDIYITNLIKCKSFYMKGEEEIHSCHDYIKQELSVFKEGIVILIGIKTCKYLFGNTFNPYFNLGKGFKEKQRYVIAMAGINSIYGNINDNTQLFRKSLVGAYKFYINNVDANFKSKYADYGH